MTSQELKEFFGDALSPYDGELNKEHGGLSYVIGHLTHIEELCEEKAIGYYLGRTGRKVPLFAFKEDGYIGIGCSYAHAMDSLLSKKIEGTSLEERIQKFVESHSLDEKYTIKDFWEWHRYLTLSCYGGGERFKNEHNLNEDDLISVDEFVELVKEEFGGEIISKARDCYEK